jgi:hypothetical protein
MPAEELVAALLNNIFQISYKAFGKKPKAFLFSATHFASNKQLCTLQ